MQVSIRLESTQAKDQGKEDDFGFDLLRLVLRFVGYAEESPRDSVIINPLAYKALLVECNIWRRMSLPTQQLYYWQPPVSSIISTQNV